MNIKPLRCFCAVAEAGTLARAAERLHVAPTAISMQIALLEQQLGGELFDRRSKPMTLTALGRFLLPRARELLAAGQRLEQDTRDMASGRRGWLGIGFVRSLIYSVVPAAVRAFRTDHPEVKVELIELLSEKQPEQLRLERIQIGLSRHPLASEAPAGMKHTLLFEDPFVVALPAGHALARQREVGLAALDPLEMIGFPKDPTSGYSAHVVSMLREAGARPRIGHEAIEIHTALGLVAAGLGYAIVGGSVAAGTPAGVAFRPLAELKRGTQVLAVTREHDGSPLVAAMLDVLRQQAGPVSRRSRGLRP